MAVDPLDPSLSSDPIPGPRGRRGETGATGATGAAGVNAHTATTASFTQPAVDANVDVSVANSAWIAVGQPLFLESAGFFTVVSILSPTSVRLSRQNIAGYAATSSNISSGKKVSPAGFAYVDNTQYAGLDSRVTTIEAALAVAPVRTYYQTTAPTGTIGVGSLWFDTDDNYKLHRWDGSGWVAITPTIELDPFGLGLRPVQVLDELPSSGMVEGDVVFLKTDKKLYRYTGTAWTAAVAAGDLVGTLPNGAIAANYIVAGMISAGAVNATHVGTNQIIASAANIADAVITDAKIASLSASKIVAGTIDSQIVKVKGASGSVQSDNYAAGSTGFKIAGDGTAEFNDVSIRGRLQAGRIASDSYVFNPASPASFAPILARQKGVNGSVTGSLGASGTVANLVTFYGWGTSDGFATNKFMKATTVFTCSCNGGYSVATASFADTELVYRVNGGSWVQINPFAKRSTDGNGDLVLTFDVEISGLAGSDVVEFGVRSKSPNNATTRNVVELSVTAFNL